MFERTFKFIDDLFNWLTRRFAKHTAVNLEPQTPCFEVSYYVQEIHMNTGQRTYSLVQVMPSSYGVEVIEIARNVDRSVLDRAMRDLEQRDRQDTRQPV